MYREPPKLARFEGKPSTPTPKARLFNMLGWVMPERFSSHPPFDRHDWYVQRGGENGTIHRYVIDYYAAPDGPNGEQIFYLDVRPALDSIGSIYDRVSVSSSEIWEKAVGRS